MNNVTTVTVSYAIQLQPLPSNTGISLLADVAGTTKAGDAFWTEQCKSIPTSTTFLVVTMGTVREFFKPIEGSTYCAMLQSNKKHQWSGDGVVWTTPNFYSINDHNGGSVANWPRDKGRDGDARKFLSFWGIDGSMTGGCCSSSNTEYQTYPALPGNGAHIWWGQACTYTHPNCAQSRTVPARTHTSACILLEDTAGMHCSPRSKTTTPSVSCLL